MGKKKKHLQDSIVSIMLWSQIKRAPDGFIQLRRFIDFEKSSGRLTISRHFAHAVTNQSGSGRQFFRKYRECTF